MGEQMGHGAFHRVRIWLLMGGMLISASSVADFDGTVKGGRARESDSNATCSWRSTLNPVPAVLTNDLTVAKNGLQHAGFTAANGWTILEKQLLGAFTLEKYYAWVTDQPKVFCGDEWAGGEDHGEIGGAVFKLSFARKPADPPADAIHWIQGVHHNDAAKGGKDVGGGYFDLLDNNGSRTDPTYDGNGGLAHPDCFVDIPDSECLEGCNNSVSFRFTVFISTWDARTKTITLYKSGVSWGYDFACNPVPEPSTWITLFGGGLTYLLFRSAKLRKSISPN